MPQHNLTRVEAACRSEILSVSSYEVTLVLDGEGSSFRSLTTVRFTATERSSTFIDAITESVHSLVLNGSPLSIEDCVQPGRIQLPELAADNELVVDAQFLYMNTGEGMHRFVDPVDDETYLYTQFEVPDARRVFAVFEQPDLKATFSLTVLAPKGWTVVSNSPTPHSEDPSTVEQLPELDPTGLRLWQFAPTPPLSSYITAIVAGPYRGVQSSVQSSDGEAVKLGVFTRASLFADLDADSILATTTAGFEFFEREFSTPYPFEKYDQIFVPEFNAGAMENAGAVTITENYVFRSRPTEAIVERRAVTILHELAHMWFGDLVTMTWWNDLWLNESFAEFMSTLATAEATQFTSAWTTFAALEKSWAYRQDQLPSTHPIVARIDDLADVEVNFDGITYAKGASVLKQLVAWVGRDNFFAAMGSYFNDHAWSNTELSDLLKALRDASGRDLDEWTRLWLQESGVNLISGHAQRDADGAITQVTLTQAPFVLPGQPEPSLRPHRIGVGFYTLGDDGVFARVGFTEVDLGGEEVQVPVPQRALHSDVIVVNDGDLTYAKVRFDESTLSTVLGNLGGFTDSLTQTVVLTSLWDMVRDGELPVTTYVNTVAENLLTVTQSTALLVQLRQLTTALDSYIAPQDRAGVRTHVSDVLWDLIHRAEPGSDQQFQFLLAFIKHATSEEQLQRLTSMLEAPETVPAGQKIDTDLRWEILISLSAASRIDEAQILQWRSDDDTAAGRRHAATALAAPASSSGKSQTFATLCEDTTLTNATIAATARGFAMGLEQSTGELVPAEGSLQSFDTAYFNRIAGWWDDRTLEVAQTLTQHLFPPASAASVELAEAWLAAHPDAPKGLLRLLQENLDNAKRTLRIRKADVRS